MRTEEQVIKDFEKIGYKITRNSHYFIIFKNDNEFIINIDKSNQSYECYWGDRELLNSIYMQEHKLLHELFKIWGWIE